MNGILFLTLCRQYEHKHLLSIITSLKLLQTPNIICLAFSEHTSGSYVYYERLLVKYPIRRVVYLVQVKF